MKVNGPETFRANTSKGAANRVTCLRTIDSSPNLRLSKSDSTPLGAIPDPLRLREESAKKLPIRVDYSLSLSYFREEINPWIKETFNQWRDHRTKNYNEFSPKKKWKRISRIIRSRYFIYPLRINGIRNFRLFRLTTLPFDPSRNPRFRFFQTFCNYLLLQEEDRCPFSFTKLERTYASLSLGS